MLEQLSKKNNKWLKMAYNLCGCYDLAGDMVQDMYIEIYEKHQKNPREKYEDAFIWGVMYTTMMDNQRKKVRKFRGKNVGLDCIKELVSIEKEFEVDDPDLELLERAKELRYLYRYYLIKSYDTSIRDIAKENKVNYGKVYRKLKEAREYILEEDIHKYKNRRNKHYKK